MLGKWWRLGGLLGIAFVVVWIPAYLSKGVTPVYDNPIDETRTWWQDHCLRYLLAQYVVILAGMIFLLPYMVAFTSVLGRAEGSVRLWSRVSLIGGVFFIATQLAAGAAWTALAVGADTLSDDGMRTLMYLDVGAYQVPGFGFGVFVAAASLVIATTGALPRWIGYLGLPLGVALLLAPLNVVDNGSEGFFDWVSFLSFHLANVWILATAVTMARRRDEPLLTPDEAGKSAVDIPGLPLEEPKLGDPVGARGTASSA